MKHSARLAPLLVATLLTIAGCQTLSQHSAAVQLIVSQATMRYIEQAPAAARGERAGKIVAVIDKLQLLTNGDPVTIAQLASIALAAIPSDLEASDRALAVSIVNIAAQELQNKVGEGKLSAEQLVTVAGVLLAARGAADSYARAAP